MAKRGAASRAHPQACRFKFYCLNPDFCSRISVFQLSQLPDFRMSSFLPYGRQSFSVVDIAAVCDVLRSDFLTTGPKVEEFERRFAEVVGAKHAVAVNSATSALHLAMRVVDIGPRDRVITSPNTFLASANCAAFVGATPDFSDIDPISYNLDPGALEQTWRPDTKAVVAVDYAGQPCDMPAIAEIARK